jgi:hypothetical protein
VHGIPWALKAWRPAVLGTQSENAGFSPSSRNTTEASLLLKKALVHMDASLFSQNFSNAGDQEV